MTKEAKLARIKLLKKKAARYEVLFRKHFILTDKYERLMKSAAIEVTELEQEIRKENLRTTK